MNLTSCPIFTYLSLLLGIPIGTLVSLVYQDLMFPEIAAYTLEGIRQEII